MLGIYSMCVAKITTTMHFQWRLLQWIDCHQAKKWNKWIYIYWNVKHKCWIYSMCHVLQKRNSTSFRFQSLVNCMCVCVWLTHQQGKPPQPVKQSKAAMRLKFILCSNFAVSTKIEPKEKRANWVDKHDQLSNRHIKTQTNEDSEHLWTVNLSHLQNCRGAPCWMTAPFGLRRWWQLMARAGGQRQVKLQSHWPAFAICDNIWYMFCHSEEKILTILGPGGHFLIDQLKDAQCQQ